MDYMLKRWDTFSRFLSDGKICLSNNAADQSLGLPQCPAKQQCPWSGPC